jgi:hypothetical protein
MAQSRHEYQSLRNAGAAYLHPNSRSFGLSDERTIERSFLAAGKTLNGELLSLIDGLATGSLSLRGFVSRAQAVIFRGYYIAYSLGAISIFPFYTMTDRDVRILNEELAEETGFLRSFGRDIASSSFTLDPVQRSRLYMLGLRGIFERGRVEAMPPGPYRWRLGATEHCIECYNATINGPYQRDRSSGLGLPPLPGAPGDGSVCLGLTRCGCTIELANGIPLPNEDLAERLRGLLLEVVNGPRTTASGYAAY